MAITRPGRGRAVVAAAVAVLLLVAAGAVILAMRAGAAEAEGAYLEQVHREWRAAARTAAAGIPSTREQDLYPEAVGWPDADLLDAGRQVCDGLGAADLVSAHSARLGASSAAVIERAATQQLCQ